MLDIKASADESPVLNVTAAAPSTSNPISAEVLKKQIKIEQGSSPTRKRTLLKSVSKEELFPTPQITTGKQTDEVKEKEPKGEIPTEDNVEDKSKRTRRSLIEKRVIPRGTPRKVRKSLPVVLQKDLLKRRSAGRPVLSADRKQSARLNKEIPLRSGRARKADAVADVAAAAAPVPEKVVRVIRKRARAVDKAGETTEAEDIEEDDDADLKPAAKMIKQEVTDEEMTLAVSDLESDSGHRSNSVSKCSDNSSNMDTPLHLLKKEEDNAVVVKEEPTDILSEVEAEPEETPELVEIDQSVKVIKSIDAVLHIEIVADLSEPPAVNDSLVVADVSTTPIDKPIVADTIDTPKTPKISQKTPTQSPSTRPKRVLVRPKFSSPSIAPVVDEPILEAIVHEINTKVDETQVSAEEETKVDAKEEITSEKDTTVDEKSTKIESEPEEEKPEIAVPLAEPHVDNQNAELVTEIENIKNDLPSSTNNEQAIPCVDSESEPKSTTTPTIPITPPKTPPTESPIPVRDVEGVSAISVKSFYGQPDFLENNPGIEDDPKLREIVKEHTVVDEEDVEKELLNEDVKMEIEEPVCEDNEPIDAKPPSYLPEEPTSQPPTLVKEDNTEAIGPELIDSSSDHKAEDPAVIDKNEDVPMADPDDKENLSKSSQVASTSPNRAPLAENPKETHDIPESPEKIRQKENHFLKLGLLTHHAAKIEKQKRRESMASNSGKSTGKKSSEYTGTLKTIIKLNRPAAGSESGKGKKTGRQSGALKMTLHKGRGKSGSVTATASSSSGGGGVDAAAHATDEETYYTIQTEVSFCFQCLSYTIFFVVVINKSYLCNCVSI